MILKNILIVYYQGDFEVVFCAFDTLIFSDQNIFNLIEKEPMSRYIEKGEVKICLDVLSGDVNFK